MSLIGDAARLWTIHRVLARHGLEELLPQHPALWPARVSLRLAPARWGSAALRALPLAARFQRALEELGPIFVKLGQSVSTRRDLIPPDFADELAKLQDRVTPFDPAVARALIEAALELPIEELFSEFERDPLASASIAQVHGARLRDGREVVVKVLRPQMHVAIRRDIALMRQFARLVERHPEGRRLRPLEVVAEFEKTLYDELDMVREAANAAQLRRNFIDSPALYVPEVYFDLCRENVLVIERIHGVQVSDIAELNRRGVDLSVLAARGVEVFFTQVFRDNFFHADMHPGNVFVDVSEPAEPRYIAVDFGIIGSLTDGDRRYLAENLVAFFHRDYAKVARLHVETGWVPAHTRVEEFESAIRTVCEPIFEKPLAEISFGMVLIRLFQTARRFEMEVQPQLVLLEKTLLHIEGLGRELYPTLDLWKTAKPQIERWLSEQVGHRAFARRMREELPGWGEVLPELPRLVHESLKSQVTRPAQHRTPPAASALDRGRLLAGALAVAALCAALLAGLAIGGGRPVPALAQWLGGGAAAGWLWLWWWAAH